MSDNAIHFSDYYSGNTVEALKKAAEELRNGSAGTLIIEPGDYVITTKLAVDTQTAVMTGEYGGNPQRIMFNPKFKYDVGFDLNGISDCKISAYGAKFIIDGFMEPVCIKKCENVELAGLTITHKRKPFSRGYVVRCDSTEQEDLYDVTVELDKDCPVTSKSPMLLRYTWCDSFSGTNKYGDITEFIFEDEYHIKAKVKCRGLRIGDEFNTIHTYHFRPAVHISESENITLTDVTIHTSSGMGVVGNRSENVTMNRLWVVPECGYHFSTNTDATHFTSMTGKLKFEDCVFEYQGDDFTNVHGYYQEIIEKVSDTEFYMQEKTPDGTHTQTLDYPDVGDTLELTRKSDLKVIDTYKVVEVTPLHSEWKCRVTVDHPIPENTSGLVFADTTRLPFVEVKGCYSASHFARGVLIKTHGALIEHNTFRDIQGPAIAAASESWWYEGVSPSNITIRGNRVINCGMCFGEAAGILVKSDCDNPVSKNISNVVIEDNIIDAPGAEHGIFVRGVNGLTIQRNIINTNGEGVIEIDCGE